MPTHRVQAPEWIDAAPIRVEQRIEIAAPPSQVWAVIADHVGWPRWFHAMTSVEVTGAPTGVGGQRRVAIGKLALDEEFTAWEVDRHFAFAVVRSALPMLVTLAESVRIEPVSGPGDTTTSLVVYRQGLQARPGTGWLLSLIWKRAAAQLGDALAELRRQVEVTP